MQSSVNILPATPSTASLFLSTFSSLLSLPYWLPLNSTVLYMFLSSFYHQRSSSLWALDLTSTLTLNFLYHTGKNLIVCISTHSVTKCHPNFHEKKFNIWPKVDPEFWWWKMPRNCLLLWFINLAWNKNAIVTTSIYLLFIVIFLAYFSFSGLTCINAIESDRWTFFLCILT